MGLALNDLQRLICDKTQPTFIYCRITLHCLRPYISIYIYIYIHTHTYIYIYIYIIKISEKWINQTRTTSVVVILTKYYHQTCCICLIYSLFHLRGSLKKFPDFFVWALLLIVHTWNSTLLRSYLLRLQCTCCTVPTTSRSPHGSPLQWACQWPSSQPLSPPQLSHNDDSLWAWGITKSHREQGLHYKEAEELSWCPSWSNSLWQGESCGLMHYPGWNVTDLIWRVLASSDRISCWTPLKPQRSNPNPNPLANQLWCSDFLTPPTPLIIPHRLPAFLESLMPLQNWCSIHPRWLKSSLKHSIRYWGIFSKFKIQFYCISFF